MAEESRPHDDTLVINGIDGSTGEYLLGPVPLSLFAEVARGYAPSERELDELETKTAADHPLSVPRQERQLDDLASAGWAAVFARPGDTGGEARQRDIKAALEPLLELRRAQATARDERHYHELVYESGESWESFLFRHGVEPSPRDHKKIPYYLLLVASPEEIPFGVQYQADVQYAVGRLYFTTIAEYAAYANNVVTAERGGELVRPSAAFFGARNPNDLPTELSADMLVEPLAESIRETFAPGWSIACHLGDDADKARLSTILGGPDTPSLVFTASHGIGLGHDHDRLFADQGGFVCQDWPGPGASISKQHYFAADDIGDDADLRGVVGFHFACYGAGTPEFDDFVRDGSSAKRLAPRPFVARLPQRMLGHPRGALAFIGHVDRAWDRSYRWRPAELSVTAASQISAFEDAVGHIMSGGRIGLAMEGFDMRYAQMAASLADTLHQARKQGVDPDPRQLAYKWLCCHDARNYVVIGDPAARLPSSRVPPRVPSPRREVNARSEVGPGRLPVESRATGHRDRNSPDERTRGPYVVDYVLEIHRALGGRHTAPRGIVRYLVRTPEGDAERFEIDWDALEPLLAALEAGDATAETLQTLGNALRECLSHAEWAPHEAELLAAVRERNQSVRVVIRSSAAEIYALPWELLTVESTGQHLGELPGVLVCYAWPEAASDGHGTERRRVLLAWSAAGGPIPAAAHIDALSRACRTGSTEFDRERDVIDHVSAEALRARLGAGDEPDASILHILCHGVDVGGTFGLSFSRGDGEERVDAGWLRRVLAEHAGQVRLVVLCACRSGDPGAHGSHLGSLARALHRTGIEHVIASRYPLGGDSSTRFTEVFYDRLLGHGEPVETAFMAARHELAGASSTPDWAAMQLYASPRATRSRASSRAPLGLTWATWGLAAALAVAVAAVIAVIAGGSSPSSEKTQRSPGSPASQVTPRETDAVPPGDDAETAAATTVDPTQVEEADARDDVELLRAVCLDKIDAAIRARDIACHALDVRLAASFGEHLSCDDVAARYADAQGRLLAGRGTRAARDLAQNAGMKLAECGDVASVFTLILSDYSVGGESLFDTAQTAGTDVEGALIDVLKDYEYPRSKGIYREVEVAVRWLIRNEKFGRCRELVPALLEAPWHAVNEFLTYIAAARCPDSADTVAKLLLHRIQATREQACATLSTLGAKQYADKLAILAETDPVPDVRAACKGALGRLELRD